VAPVVEHLLTKCEILSSNPIPQKKSSEHFFKHWEDLQLNTEIFTKITYIVLVFGVKKSVYSVLLVFIMFERT
jgi:hypothetical protein